MIPPIISLEEDTHLVSVVQSKQQKDHQASLYVIILKSSYVNLQNTFLVIRYKSSQVYKEKSKTVKIIFTLRVKAFNNHLK